MAGEKFPNERAIDSGGLAPGKPRRGRFRRHYQQLAWEFKHPRKAASNWGLHHKLYSLFSTVYSFDAFESEAFVESFCWIHVQNCQSRWKTRLSGCPQNVLNNGRAYAALLVLRINFYVTQMASPLSSTSAATTMRPEVKCVHFGTVAPFPSA